MIERRIKLWKNEIEFIVYYLNSRGFVFALLMFTFYFEQTKFKVHLCIIVVKSFFFGGGGVWGVRCVVRRGGDFVSVEKIVKSPMLIVFFCIKLAHLLLRIAIIKMFSEQFTNKEIFLGVI